MRPTSDILLRIFNGVRKVAAGLRPFSESVWPGVRNDLFVAHESIYAFAARHAKAKAILDAGCGTGYGSAALAAAGAEKVTGVDLDPANVRYAARHYRDPRLRFRVGDLEHLEFPQRSFGVVIASNSLEHLNDPSKFLRDLGGWLCDDGVAIVAVPPILSPEDLAVHQAIDYHRSNLTIDEWHRRLSDAGFSVFCYSHRTAREEVRPDFSSRAASRLTPDDFTFVETDLAGLHAAPSITAVFEARIS